MKEGKQKKRNNKKNNNNKQRNPAEDEATSSSAQVISQQQGNDGSDLKHPTQSTESDGVHEIHSNGVSGISAEDSGNGSDSANGVSSAY